MKGTGVYHFNPIGQREEVEQRSIDAWCSDCRFSYAGKRCTDKVLIQRCWDESASLAFLWHLRHECPFLYRGKSCRCNEWKPHERNKTFEACSLDYNQRYKWSITMRDFKLLLKEVLNQRQLDKLKGLL